MHEPVPSVRSADLRESWAVTLRHLAACRYYLTEMLPSDEARSCEVELQHLLHHNELGLALEAAESLGLLCAAPPGFWRELQLAANNMGLDRQAAVFADRARA